MDERESTDRVLDLLASRATEARPQLLAIDGLAGAGKTTLTAALCARRPDAIVIELDDFYRPAGGENGLDGQQRCAQYFEWRRAREQAILPLLDGREARFRRYDWSANGPREWRDLAPSDLVIVEGVFALLPELRELYAASVFVDTTPGERRARIYSRAPVPDGALEWYETWSQAERWYLEELRPRDYADLVVPGGSSPSLADAAEPTR